MDAENKGKQLYQVQRSLTNILSFLQDNLPLANAHASDFIVSNQWETLIPNAIQTELLQFSDDELKQLPLLGQKCVHLEKETFHSSATHLVSNDICSDTDFNRNENDHEAINIKEKAVYTEPENVQTGATLSMTIKYCSDIDCDKREVYGGEVDNTGTDSSGAISSKTCARLMTKCEKIVTKPAWHHRTVKDFCQEAWRCSIDGQGLSTSVQDLLFNLQMIQSTQKVVPAFMNQKKSYEIEIISSVCATLAKHRSCDLVLDVGSGKGYLGSHLYLLHGLSVLGIDSVTSHTTAAVQRSVHLAKQWNSLTKETDPSGQKLSKKERRKLARQRREEKRNMTSDLSISDKSLVDNVTMDTEIMRNMPCSVCSSGVCKCELYVSGVDKTPSLTEGSFVEKNQETKKFVSVTMFVSPETDVQDIVKTHFPIPPTSKVKQQKKDTPNVDSGSQSLDSPSVSASKIPECSTVSMATLLLTGLHTCGNLGSSMLRLFVNNPDIHVVCSVGCCYHLIDEEFCDKSEADVSYGFPLSQFLKQKTLGLGRVARNLASQSAHRITTFTELQGSRFFPRALLQKILQDSSTVDPKSVTGLRNLEQRSKDTRDYIKKALDRLGVPEIVDQEIDRYLQTYGGMREKMAAFFQLRAALAPCIESVILLDRVCFLLEQDDVTDVSLVKLFDPYKSPRCYAIVAWKKYV